MICDKDDKSLFFSGEDLVFAWSFQLEGTLFFSSHSKNRSRVCDDGDVCKLKQSTQWMKIFRLFFSSHVRVLAFFLLFSHEKFANALKCSQNRRRIRRWYEIVWSEWRFPLLFKKKCTSELNCSSTRKIYVILTLMKISMTRSSEIERKKSTIRAAKTKVDNTRVKSRWVSRGVGVDEDVERWEMWLDNGRRTRVKRGREDLKCDEISLCHKGALQFSFRKLRFAAE